MKINKKFAFCSVFCYILILATLLTFVSCEQKDSDETNTTATTTTTTTTVPTPDSDPDPTPDPDPVQMLPAQELKILDQNVMCNTDSISARAPEMAAYLLASGADSIGVQECVSQWATILDQELGGKYARVGVDINGADKGWFATYVYYRKDKYRVIDTDTFWMSTTPDVPSKYSETVDMNRTCTWVILEDIQTGFRYVHMNCHLDWMDKSVNVVQTQMIRNMMIRFAEMGYPVFATGDYNTPEGSISYGQMLSCELIVDSKHVAETTTDTPSHHGEGASIDYCFVTADNITVHEYDVIDHIHNGVEVSDHNGIYVHATVHSLPKQSHKDALPQFADGTEIQTTKSLAAATQMNIQFPQAKSADGWVAKHYDVKMYDSDGKFVYQTIAYANSNRPLQPLTVSTQLIGGMPGNNYQIRITPISVFGECGNTLIQTVTWLGEPLVALPVDAPDILDVSVKDGVVADASPNHFTISQNGSVNVTQNAMVFDKSGNIRTSLISDSEYAKMTDGFTMEVVLTTGNDIQSSLPYVCNHHAGGFGINCDGGRIAFSVHNGSSYIYTYASIEKNTTYHIVGIYDGTYVRIYLNGVFVAMEEVVGSMKIPTVDSAKFLCFGADSDASGNGEYPSEVTVYSTAIYSQILTDGQVLYLYQNQ